MRWLVLCAMVLCLATTTWAADTGNFSVIQKGYGDGGSDGRQGGEGYADAAAISSLPFVEWGNTCDNVQDVVISCLYSSDAPDVFYSFTPAADMSLEIRLCGSFYDTALEIQDSAHNVVDCNDDYCNLQSGLEAVAVTAGETYYIIVSGYSTACGYYVVKVWETGTAEPSTPLPCEIECPDGAQLEGEPICNDAYIDNYNGGCNSTPWVFQNICPTEGQSTVICGTSGTYNGGFRDTDWFRVFGNNDTMTATLYAQFPAQLLFIFGTTDCDIADEELLYATGMCTPLTLSYFEPQGAEAWIWVGPDVFESIPCGWEYILTLEGIYCTPVPADPDTWGQIKSQFR